MYYGHDLHFRRLRQQAEVLDDVSLEASARRMEALERSVWRSVDVVLYPSDDEAALVAQLEPGVTARAILPYGFADFATPRSPPPRRQILFVGGFSHPPNQEAVLWFVEHVLPLIRERVNDVTLAIVGSNPSLRLLTLADARITVSGNVSDAALHDHYRGARVAVVPLRYGAGVKLKVVEALREGVPLVTTAIGAQGLPGLAGVASVCQGEQEFADAVCRLLRDDDQWRQQCAAQLDYATRHFSQAAFHTSLQEAVAIVQSPVRCATRRAS